MPDLVLASGSAIRAKILRAAGIPFTIVKPDIDESAIKLALTGGGAGLEEVAIRLAEAKALAVPAPPEKLVLGSDQILEHRGRLFDKPRDRREAHARLLELQGDVHSLINAVAVAHEGRIVFRHLDRPRLYMRPMTGPEIERYLDTAGGEVLASVGAYQIEALGARLFERIEGDHFAVLGLSLFPVLAFLREQGIGAF
jgi:septum formation protein